MNKKKTNAKSKSPAKKTEQAPQSPIETQSKEGTTKSSKNNTNTIPTETSTKSKGTKKGNAKTQQQKKPKVNQEELKKQKEKEEQYKKLEAYINESGLSLAFNIIFAELIAKQILPENFFTYTAMRLKQIGKEIEGMKTKVPMYIDKPEVEEEGEKVKTEGDEPNQEEEENKEEGNNNEENNEEDEVFMTRQKQKK